MLSAFGVDHGEISKIAVRKPPETGKVARFLARGKGKAGQATDKVLGPKIHNGGRMGGRATAAQQRTAGQGPAVPGSRRGVRGALNRAGEADISVKGIGGSIGRGAGMTGAFMQRHPGLTGTAAVGGGGAAGYKILSDKEPKRKKTVE